MVPTSMFAFCLAIPTSSSILNVFFQIPDIYGAIPLHYACRFLENDDMIGFFLNFPQLFNHETHDKKKPIDIMIEYNDPDVIKHFFDLRHIEEEVVALSPENKVLSLLKQQYEESINHDHGRLSFACRQLHGLKTVSHLINPYSIMHCDKQTGLTPLMVAVQHRQLECIKELLNNKYFTQEAFELVSNVSFGTVLHICPKVHHKEITKALFNSRFMSNTLAITADVLGDTPLHTCAQVGNVYMTRILLGYIIGHNSSVMTSSYSPTRAPANYGSAIRHTHAALTKKNKEKLTPLHVAIQAGHLDVINEMLEYAHASVINMCDDQQRTSLHMAAAKGKEMGVGVY
jgi:ankyrin repeat protein